MQGSNLRPLACKASALPAELILQGIYAWRRPTLAETTSRLPSALKSLTAVFEMGTGVTSSLLLPDRLCIFQDKNYYTHVSEKCKYNGFESSKLNKNNVHQTIYKLVKPSIY